MAISAVLPISAQALVTGELADRVADVITVIVIIFVPMAGIYLFWKVHILPEQVAEKRQHPQKDAIRILCLLSLVFGGLLWPLAWIWAYSKPVLHKIAYGTDKYRADEERNPVPDSTVKHRLDMLRDEIERLSDQGAAPEDVALLKRDLARLEEKLVPTPRPETH
ncbi:MAG TPA: DUF3302 domain-containing protein [Burkholderiales bacterium]|nr:DUF3302 domain-containing protein [Burkholderiales bacterium]